MIRAAGINLGGNVVAALLSALMLVVAINALSVGEWGRSAALLGAGQFAGAFLSFGTQVKSLRDLSALERSEFAVRALPASLSRLFVGLTVTLLGLLVFGFNESIGCVILVSGGVYVSLGAIMPLIAAKRYGLSAGCLVLEKSIAVAVSAWTLPLLGELAVPVAVSAAGILIGVVALALLRAQGAIATKRSVASSLTEQWKGSFSFGVASVAPSALLLDVALVTLVAGSTTAGVYSIGAKLVAPLSVAATTVVQVLMPRMASSSGSGQLKISRRAGLIGSVAIISASAAAAALVPEVVTLLLGERYAEAAWPIRFFVLNAGLVLVTRTLVTILQAWRHESLAAALVAGQVVIALAGVAVFASQGAAAAAGAVFGSNAVLAVALVSTVARVNRLR